MTEWVMTVLDQIMGQTAPHARRHSCCRVSLSARAECHHTTAPRERCIFLHAMFNGNCTKRRSCSPVPVEEHNGNRKQNN